MTELLNPIKKSLDEFSLNLYHEIATKAKGNIFMSPLSISSALLPVYVGARKETRKEIEALLGIQENFGGDESEVLKAYGEVLQVFAPTLDAQGEKAFDLTLANKTYIQSGCNINPDFIDKITKNLRSELAEVSFKQDAEGARQEINQWVEGKTNNKIKDLLVSGVLDCDTVVVLVNAIYFKADWLSKFDVKLTTKEDFYGLSGQNSKVDLMSIRKKKYQYFDNDEVKLPLPPFQMIELPYKEEQMSMLILLPKDKNGLIELEKGLTGEVLRNIHHACSSRTVDVWLPRFRLEETYKLVPVLQKLGVTKLFSDADLSGVADIPLVVSEVVHKAFVEVNEEGTEAAAATAAVMMSRSMPPPPVQFRADHPFIFAIRHQRTGLITFLGRVAQL